MPTVVLVKHIKQTAARIVFFSQFPLEGTSISAEDSERQFPVGKREAWPALTG